MFRTACLEWIKSRCDPAYVLQLASMHSSSVCPSHLPSFHVMLVAYVSPSPGLNWGSLTWGSSCLQIQNTHSTELSYKESHFIAIRIDVFWCYYDMIIMFHLDGITTPLGSSQNGTWFAPWNWYSPLLFKIAIWIQWVVKTPCDP